MDQQTTAKGSYREVLDWFLAQIDRLDEHTRQVDSFASQMTAQQLDAQRQAIVEAQAWLADQLAEALGQRGLAAAA